jgi:hypothetical protein
MYINNARNSIKKLVQYIKTNSQKINKLEILRNTLWEVDEDLFEWQL